MKPENDEIGNLSYCKSIGHDGHLEPFTFKFLLGNARKHVINNCDETPSSLFDDLNGIEALWFLYAR